MPRDELTSWTSVEPIQGCWWSREVVISIGLDIQLINHPLKLSESQRHTTYSGWKNCTSVVWRRESPPWAPPAADVRWKNWTCPGRIGRIGRTHEVIYAWFHPRTRDDPLIPPANPHTHGLWFKKKKAQVNCQGVLHHRQKAQKYATLN